MLNLSAGIPVPSFCNASSAAVGQEDATRLLSPIDKSLAVKDIYVSDECARETPDERTPNAVVAPGVPELSPILGSSRPYGGVSGDGVPYSQHTYGSNTSVGGWGAATVRLTHKARDGALSYSIMR